MGADEANGVGDEDGEAGGGAPASKVAHALLLIRAALGPRAWPCVVEVVVVAAEGGERKKRRKARKEKHIVRLESVEWSLRWWWMYGDFSSFNFLGVGGHIAAESA